MKEIEKVSTYSISNWQHQDIDAMYAVLEIPNWAPWLAASKSSLHGRIDSFPQGQLVVKDAHGGVFASLSMNKIKWDGNPFTLPSWDEVAGDPTTYEQTYVSDGNTLTLMSMNVHPQHQGEGHARNLIEKAKQTGIDLGVDYIIGSFRPNEYGKYKFEHGKKSASFEEYCKLKREDGLPVDSWIRNLTRNGMVPLIVDKNAMRVELSTSELFKFKSKYKPHLWKRVDPLQDPLQIECGEVGNWTIEDEGIAVYQESNLWGMLWKKTGLP